MVENDVTSQVRSAISNDSLALTASNNVFGESWYRNKKSFVIVRISMTTTDLPSLLLQKARASPSLKTVLICKHRTLSTHRTLASLVLSMALLMSQRRCKHSSETVSQKSMLTTLSSLTLGWATRRLLS